MKIQKTKRRKYKYSVGSSFGKFISIDSLKKTFNNLPDSKHKSNILFILSFKTPSLFVAHSFLSVKHRTDNDTKIKDLFNSEFKEKNVIKTIKSMLKIYNLTFGK